MIIPLIVIAWPWLSSYASFTQLGDFFAAAPEILGTRLMAIGMYGAGAISSQLIGRIIRNQEKQSLDILDTLNFYKRTNKSQLSSQLNFSESKIDSLLKKMSRISSLGIVYDGDMVTIGQMKETVPPEPAKNENADQKEYSFIKILSESKAASASNDIQKQEELKKIAQDYFENKTKNSGKSGKRFSVIIFIILFFTPLWPIALILAISIAVKQQKAQLAKKEK
jgi:hypothetical protein